MAARSTLGIKEVAVHAGVSMATVSRVINGGPYIRDSVRERVTASMKMLGYEPHALAQSLRTGQTRTIGYIINDISNFLFSTIARGIDDHLQERGYTMFVANSRGDAQREAQLIKLMQRRRVDGLILSLSDETHEETHGCLEAITIPLVLLDREVAGLTADRVMIDHYQGVREALVHLHSLGHRRIAVISGPDSIRPGREFRLGFERTLQELRVQPAPELIQSGALRESFAYQAMATLLELPELPTAVLVGDALVLIGALRCLHDRRVRTPDDLSLIGFDDTDVTELASPAITVIARDVYQIGYQAAQLLLERLDPACSLHSRSVLIPTRLIIRGSTAAPSAVQ